MYFGGGRGGGAISSLAFGIVMGPGDFLLGIEV